MKETQHPNSKKITIFRAGSFINSAQTNAQEFMSMSKKSIGSYWESVTKKGIGSGLTFEEIDLLMPRILDIPKEDRNFRLEVRKFFQSIVTRIPYGRGLELEIGMSKSNTEPLSESNLPLEVMDFIRWRHAMGHPKVARNLKDAQGDQLKEFYIFDKDDVIRESASLDALKDEALTSYMTIKNDNEKIIQMLTLLNVDPKSFKGKNAEALRLQALRDKATNDATSFVKVYKLDNFEDRFRVQSMMNAGILRKIGEQIVDAETTEVIGHTMEEAIYFFKDSTKSSQITILKQKLQEANKELLASRKKGAESAEFVKVPAGVELDQTPQDPE